MFDINNEVNTEKMNLNKKAEMGMGTLIIFIAMILVAAIAAAVLISTTSSLQNKALETGSATTQEVGTSMNVLEIYGEDGSEDETVDGFATIVKLSAGSDSIRFEDLLVTLSLSNDSEDYSYDADAQFDCDDIGTGTVSAGEYTVEYSLEGPNNRPGFLTPGDVAKVCFGSPRAVGETERIRLSLIPRVGTVNTIETALPNLIIDQRQQIFP